MAFGKIKINDIMAKICINSKCKKEIPSSATYCPHCSRQQVENENLSEEEKLRKEVIEAEKEIERLKNSLDLAQEHIKKGTSDKLNEATLNIKQLTEELRTMEIKLDSTNKQLLETFKKLSESEQKLSVEQNKTNVLHEQISNIEEQSASIKDEPIKKPITKWNLPNKIIIIGLSAVVLILIIVMIVSSSSGYYKQEYENISQKYNDISNYSEEIKTKLTKTTSQLNDLKDTIKNYVGHVDNLKVIENIEISVEGFRVTRPDGAIFRYSGTIKNGLPNGFGRANYVEDKEYRGSFVNGYRQGKGEMVYHSNGKKEYGEWKQDSLIENYKNIGNTTTPTPKPPDVPKANKSIERAMPMKEPYADKLKTNEPEQKSYNDMPRPMPNSKDEPKVNPQQKK